MAGALTPDQALAYLRELNPHLRDAAVGSPHETLQGVEGAIRVRSENREIAVIPGPLGLPGLLAHDAERALEVMKP